jgi:hypothetical protein
MADYLHSSIFNGSDEKGTITTTTNPQVFQMADESKSKKCNVIQLRITTYESNPVNIKLNDESSIICIEIGDKGDKGTDGGSVSIKYEGTLIEANITECTSGGGSTNATINDTAPSSTTSYSGTKVESIKTELNTKIGDLATQGITEVSIAEAIKKDRLQITEMTQKILSQEMIDKLITDIMNNPLFIETLNTKIQEYINANSVDISTL